MTMPALSHRSRRRRGQSIVEFGLVALMFTLLLFGVIDLGILMNGWLGVSSSARDIARQMAVGICPPIGTLGYVAAQPPPNPTNPCASGGTGAIPNAPAPSALQIQGVDWTHTSGGGPVQITVNICSSDLTSCSPGAAAYTTSNLLNLYPSGTCDIINNPTTTCGTTVHPTPNDAVQVSVVAYIEVVTPLVRPFFGCPGSVPHCDVPITSTAVARYEGNYI